MILLILNTNDIAYIKIHCIIFYIKIEYSKYILKYTNNNK